MTVISKPPSGKLHTKISPLIDGQLPDFIQSDHPVFSKFLKHYYEYLEAGELVVTVTIDKLLLNLETTSYALDVDGNKIVLEDGAGTSGKFVVGDTITGGTSKATATVLVDDLGNANTPRLFITSQQKFVTGETVTGAISGSGTVDRYRANPIQTIQQLLDYADIDNTLYDFLDNFRDEFMNAIPLTLTDGANKRRLLKNIRELYRAKGTSEGHKIFMRLLLGEDPEVTYPAKFMMKPSDGNWASQTLMRVTPGANAVASEVVGTTLTGGTFGATAVIASAVEFVEGNTLIVEFELNPDSLDSTYNFWHGETVSATSTVQDFVMSFTVKNIVSEAVVTDRSALYKVGDPIVFDTNTNIGNGLAEARIDNISAGKVLSVGVDDAGTGYKVGDVLTFTTTDSNTKSPEGFVSIIDGSIALDGTSKYYTDDNARRIDEEDFILLETGTIKHLEFFEIELETWTTGASGEKLILDGTDGSSTNAGQKIDMEWSIFQASPDTYGTVDDRWVLEEETLANLSDTDIGSIQKLHMKDAGGGFLTIPTVAVASVNTVDGTGAKLIAETNDIGSAGDVVITNEGFNYSSVPFMEFRANFTLKDVSGTFALGNALVSPHVGEIVSYDTDTQILTTTIKDVVRIPLETGDNEGITLEDGLRLSADVKFSEIKLNRTEDSDEKIVDEQSGERIVLNATATSDAYFVLEDGTGETAGSAIVYEQPDEMYNPPMRLETDTFAGTWGISLEDGVPQGHGSWLAENAAGDSILIETAESIGSASTQPGHQLEKMLLEGNLNIPGEALNPIVLSGHGDYIVTNFSIDESDSNIIFNGTDQYYTNEDGVILNEETGDNNIIILDGTDADGTDAEGKLLHDIDTASGTDLLVLDGIDSSSTGIDDNIVHENYIDFFDGATGINPTPTSITDESGATGKILRRNIARGTASIATTVETNKTYGEDIESLIGEDLNRIQDSYYYQQFSYELSTGYGVESYLTKLKKAVHPAGFAVFGKVKIQSSVSAGVQAAGSRLGDAFYDPLLSPDEKFSPILASTFEILFDEPIQRRFGVPVYDSLPGKYEEQLILEDSESQDINLGDSIILESSVAPPSYLIEESPSHTDGRIMLDVHASGHGAVQGQLVLNGTDASSTNAGDAFVLESSEEYTSNLVFDGTEDYGYYSDAGSDILLDGTDSSKSNAGSSFELEDANMGIESKRFGLYVRPPTATLLNESGGTMQTEESSHGGGSDYDLSVVSYVTAKIDLPLTTPKSLSTGLVTIGRTPFINSRSGIQLEKATGGERLVMDWNYVPVVGRAPRLDSQGYTAGGPGYAIEHGFNPLDESAGIVLEDGILGIPSNDYGFTLEEIENCTNNYTMLDIIRSDILLISSDPDHNVGPNADPGVGIMLEGSEDGKFKQEDAATAAGGISYDILLEEGVGFGTNNKLLFEGTRIEVEDSINQGTVPYQNYTNSTLHPWTRPSHVTTSEYGGVALEDSITGQLLVNATDGSASDAGSKFKFEYFTDDFTHDSAASVHFSPIFGRFDSTEVSWDSVSLGREEYLESEPKTFDQPY